MNNSKILILGDFHLNTTKQVIEGVQSFTIEPNTKWVCSKWALIKTAKKEYLKYKKDSGTPLIVVLSVGNNDLTKVSSEHCIITSLLRLANFLHKDGVRAVVLFSLVERSSPVGPYNEQVKEINRVLQSRAKKISWLFFFLLWEKTLCLGTNGLIKGHQLVTVEHIRIGNLLQNLIKQKDISSFLQKEKDTDDDSKLSQSHCSRDVPVASKEITHVQKQALFLPEIERLKGKLNLMTKEKAKTQEYLNKLTHSISSMNEYIVHLEKITT